MLPVSRGAFAARRFFHHLYHHFLLRGQEFCNCSCRAFKAQRAEVCYVHEPVTFGVSNIDECRIYPGKYIFYNSQVNVADLVAACGYHKFLDLIF